MPRRRRTREAALGADGRIVYMTMPPERHERFPPDFQQLLEQQEAVRREQLEQQEAGRREQLEQQEAGRRDRYAGDFTDIDQVDDSPGPPPMELEPPNEPGNHTARERWRAPNEHIDSVEMDWSIIMDQLIRLIFNHESNLDDKEVDLDAREIQLTVPVCATCSNNGTLQDMRVYGIRGVRKVTFTNVCICPHREYIKLAQLWIGGYMPYSVKKPGILFSRELLNMYDKLFIHTSAQVNGFVIAWERWNKMNQGKIQSLFTFAFRKWLTVQFLLEKRTLGDDHEPYCRCCPNKWADEWMDDHGAELSGPGYVLLNDQALENEEYVANHLNECVVAFAQKVGIKSLSNRVQVSCDGDFKITHRRSRDGPELQDDIARTYFAEDDEWRPFINANGTAGNVDPCNNFTALKESIKSKTNDIRGIFGAFDARHLIPMPKTFADIPEGEGLSYADRALGFVCKAFPDKDINFFYDVACKFVVNVDSRVRLQQLHTGDIAYMIPAMHLYAHQRQCRRKFSSREFQDTGLTHGEGHETQWSVLNTKATQFREMTKAGRSLALGYTLYDLAKRIIDSLGESLVEDFNDVVNEIKSLKKLIRKCGGWHALCTTFIALRQAEQEITQTNQSQTEFLYGKYAFNLFLYYRKSNVASQELVNAITCHERQHGIARWTVQNMQYRVCLFNHIKSSCQLLETELKNCFIDKRRISQMIDRTELTTRHEGKYHRKIRRIYCRIRALIEQYNEYVDAKVTEMLQMPEVQMLPEEITVLERMLLPRELDNLEDENIDPIWVKLRSERASEELKIVMEEMVTLLMTESMLINHCKIRFNSYRECGFPVPLRLQRLHVELNSSFFNNFTRFKKMNFYR